jgi:predicted dehydrogenase
VRFLAIGAGSIGTRHSRNLIDLGHVVTLWDWDSARLDLARRELDVEVATSLEHGLGRRPEGVVICTPPATHMGLARRAIEAGAHLFVEKPLADSTDEVPALLDAARRGGRVLAVGFNLRFLPSLRRVKALLDQARVRKVFSVRAQFGFYLPIWRRGRDYRENYAVRAAEGGGVLLDAIHELDYLGWLFGEAQEVFCTAGHVSELAGDTEDLAEVTIRFGSGVLAQVHLDYLRRAYRRDLEIIGEAGVILWDYSERSVRILGPAPDQVETEVGTDDAPNEAMYVEEMRHFVRCIEGLEEPLVDGWEALRSLRMVEASRISAAERRWVKI